MEYDDGWWRGRVGDKEGVFPSNFVETIQEDSKSGGREETTRRKCNQYTWELISFMAILTWHENKAGVYKNHLCCTRKINFLPFH